MNLYPEIEPFDSGYFDVSDLHTIYYEQVGNPKGQPIVFLHGGPGGGICSDYRRYFDPKKWRVILFDQRGCGKSSPFAELKENTTWDLVEDIEKLRKFFSISSWSLFGGSWGSTLALSYATTYPDSCVKLFLRGIFLLRKKEIDWFYKEGASRLFPDFWEGYLAPLSEEERKDPLKAYHKILSGPPSTKRLEAARAWSVWEASTSKLIPDRKSMEDFGEDDFATAFARIESHFFINKGFFESDEDLLKKVEKIRHLPAIIVHGRYDVVCPFESAWELHKKWPESELKIADDSGHSLSETNIQSILLKALNE